MNTLSAGGNPDTNQPIETVNIPEHEGIENLPGQNAEEKGSSSITEVPPTNIPQKIIPEKTVH